MSTDASQSPPATVSVRLDAATLAAFDAFIAAMPEPRPSRSDALKGILERAIGTVSGPANHGRRPEDLNAGNDD